ncbi:haloacid dehalogenase-like hydrolase [Opitutaceae bacterium TAV3]|nr:haloacid dehalogenase-like hydrolase [Opitutaceae bacterium TAV3]
MTTGQNPQPNVPKRSPPLRFVRFLAVTLALASPALAQTPVASPPPPDPLPSWHDTTTKATLLAFVAAVTTEGAPAYVAPPDRVAVFDHDGTLCAEQPNMELLFFTALLKNRVATEPELAAQPAVRALATNDTVWLRAHGQDALRQLITLAYGNRTEASFIASVQEWARYFRHPTTHRSVSGMVYQPMRELLDLLRANGFELWICTGSTERFVQVISAQLYGIPPERVIGSTIKTERRIVDGREVLWRLPIIEKFNENEAKVAAIQRRIGRTPILACGNAGTGSDVAMLRHTQDLQPGRASLALLIQHDDGFRDARYGDDDVTSLAAASSDQWTLVSVSRDWARIFPDLVPGDLSSGPR